MYINGMHFGMEVIDMTERVLRGHKMDADGVIRYHEIPLVHRKPRIVRGSRYRKGGKLRYLGVLPICEETGIYSPVWMLGKYVFSRVECSSNYSWYYHGPGESWKHFAFNKYKSWRPTKVY